MSVPVSSRISAVIASLRPVARTQLRQRPWPPKPQQRALSSSLPKKQQYASLEEMKAENHKKNMSTLYYGIAVGVGTVALAYGSVPMYKMICQQTGWSGQPVKAHDKGETEEEHGRRLKPVTDHRRLRITFNGSTSDVLPWKFTPQQREVKVLPGETALAFFTATNMSEADIIGVATYGVTPPQVAPYFSKIQCFCFEEQRLNAGETVDMPVFFFIDPDFIKDPAMRNIDTITLSYTFFKARYDKNGILTTMPMAVAA
jgi:cytochrome c oxidase assembly protein subunit 11